MCLISFNHFYHFLIFSQLSITMQPYPARQAWMVRFRVRRNGNWTMSISCHVSTILSCWWFNESRMKITDEAFSDVGPPASESFVWPHMKVFSKHDVFNVLECLVQSCSIVFTRCVYWCLFRLLRLRLSKNSIHSGRYTVENWSHLRHSDISQRRHWSLGFLIQVELSTELGECISPEV